MFIMFFVQVEISKERADIMKNTHLTNREVYFDILRIISTFAVMILHIAGQNWSNTDIRSFEWNVFNFYNSVVRWGVPVFIMISGSLFLNGNQSLDRIYKKNILRIVTAFIFWSFFYAAISFIRGEGIKSALISFIGGHYHMWFLFLIVGLYMIIPFLKVVVNNDFLTRYFLVLAIIFTFVMPQIISTISIGFENYGAIIESIVYNIHMHLVLGYTLYFILGYYLNKIVISKKLTRIIYVLGIFGFASTVLLTVWVTYYSNKPNELFYGNLTLNVLFEAVFVFVLCKNHFSNVKFSEKTKKILYHLSKYSFGAYLIHAFMISVIDQCLGLNSLSFNSLIAVPVIGVLIFCASFFLSAIINNIPLLNKYIV